MQDPLGTISYNLGIISDAQHQAVWLHLIQLEATRYQTQLELSRKYKKIISKYNKKIKIYKKIKQHIK